MERSANSIAHAFKTKQELREAELEQEIESCSASDYKRMRYIAEQRSKAIRRGIETRREMREYGKQKDKSGQQQQPEFGRSGETERVDDGDVQPTSSSTEGPIRPTSESAQLPQRGSDFRSEDDIRRTTTGSEESGATEQKRKRSIGE